MFLMVQQVDFLLSVYVVTIGCTIFKTLCLDVYGFDYLYVLELIRIIYVLPPQ